MRLWEHGLYVMYIGTQGVHGSSFSLSDVLIVFTQSCRCRTRCSVLGGRTWSLATEEEKCLIKDRVHCGRMIILNVI